ncbi:MAG: peptidoglycan-binding domain-containing protein [Planctomycetota bacterium]
MRGIKGSGEDWIPLAIRFQMQRALLKIGSRGDAVALLQQALNEAKSTLQALSVDSIFGVKTRRRVMEFQTQRRLQVDGMVGDQTHGALVDIYDLIDQLGKALPPPESIQHARDRIVEIAQILELLFGWSPTPHPSNKKSGKLPPPGSQRIAAKYRTTVGKADHRQGGAKLSEIFASVGHPGAAKCLTLTDEAETMYKTNPTPSDKERNNKDIVSWCGIFAMHVHKMAGLKIGDWPYAVKGLETRDKFTGKILKEAVYRPVSLDQMDAGDVGYLPGRNHHFIVTRRDGNRLESIDGNEGLYQSIIKKIYWIEGSKSNPTAEKNPLRFLSPVWEKVGVGR